MAIGFFSSSINRMTGKQMVCYGYRTYTITIRIVRVYLYKYIVLSASHVLVCGCNKCIHFNPSKAFHYSVCM